MHILIIISWTNASIANEKLCRILAKDNVFIYLCLGKKVCMFTTKNYCELKTNAVLVGKWSEENL